MTTHFPTQTPDQGFLNETESLIHKKWSTLIAVLSGNFMFAIAFQNPHNLPQI